MFKLLKFKFIEHKNKLKALSEMAKSIADFAITKSNFSLVSGAISATEGFLGSDFNDPRKFFSPASGWIPISSHEPIHSLFNPVLNQLEGKRLPFEYDNVKIFATEVGNIVALYDRFNPTEVSILVEEEKKQQLLEFLVNKKLEELKTQYMSLDEINLSNGFVQLLLSPLKITSITSERSKQTINDLQKAFDKGFSRSFILYGLPGTGKSTLAQTIINHFKFRTFKIYPGDNLKLPYLLELIELFKIEAIILDDFDQIEMNEKLLEFLEIINTKTKLVIGIANVLEAFDPAVLRPGRFDEEVKFDNIETSALQDILGDLFEEYQDKVKEWPIAYIKEFVKQYSINPETLQIKYEDLNFRVKKLKESYVTEEKNDEDDNK